MLDNYTWSKVEFFAILRKNEQELAKKSHEITS